MVKKVKTTKKGLGYFEIYEEYFKKLRLKKLNILEIGVEDGGSIKIWKKYYSDLGVKIPQNKLGINPGSMSLSDKIEIVHKYGIPDGTIR